MTRTAAFDQSDAEEEILRRLWSQTEALVHDGLDGEMDPREIECVD
jgi:hypothetical protein